MSRKSKEQKPRGAEKGRESIVDGAPTGELKSSLGVAPATVTAPPERAGLGIDSAGQAGDTIGLSREEFSSESVEDLSEEGQAYEAAFVAGVEDAAEAGEAGVPRLKPRKESAP